MPKYTNRKVVINDSELYDDLIKERNVDTIRHYRTFFFGQNLNKNKYFTKEYIWTQGDRLHKIASIFYGDHNLWWVIALWNGKPTDAHYFYGDIISIPMPVEEVIRDIEG